MLGERVRSRRCKTGLYLPEASCLGPEVGGEWQWKGYNNNNVFHNSSLRQQKGDLGEVCVNTKVRATPGEVIPNFSLKRFGAPALLSSGFSWRPFHVGPLTPTVWDVRSYLISAVLCPG